MNKKFVAMVAGVLLAGPMAANAVPITTSVGTFEFDVIEDNFSDISGILAAQVWWGNDALANEFAILTAQTLGISALNSSIFHENVGALFAFCNNACLFGIGQFPIEGYTYSFDRSSPDFLATNGFATDNRVHAYAVATRVPTSVAEPGTLALFGLGLAGLGFARRRAAFAVAPPPATQPLQRLAASNQQHAALSSHHLPRIRRPGGCIADRQ